jgi:hypothetical protein
MAEALESVIGWRDFLAVGVPSSHASLAFGAAWLAWVW